jgi:hypothetical protein
MESFYQNQLLPHFFGGFGRHIYKSQSDVRHDYDEMIVHQHNVMATLEHRLDHSDFLQGSILTAADILLFFHCALRFRYGDDLEDFPNMKKWYGMVSEVDAVNKNWPKGWNRKNKMSAGRQSESHVSESHEKPTAASFDTPLIQYARERKRARAKASAKKWEGRKGYQSCGRSGPSRMRRKRAIKAAAEAGHRGCGRSGPSRRGRSGPSRLRQKRAIKAAAEAGHQGCGGSGPSRLRQKRAIKIHVA